MKQLVVNGCSYTAVYSMGQGHVDLAKQLCLDHADSLAIGGSANSRIIRTTAKHAYSTQQSTLYVIGLTFMSRWEAPVAHRQKFANMVLEGKWVNPQKQDYEPSWNWTNRDTELFTELNFKSAMGADEDLFEDLVYKCLTLLDFLKSRDHTALFINQCDLMMKQSAELPKFDFLNDHKEFVDKLTWVSNIWQAEHGVPETMYDQGVELPPVEARHRLPGHHSLVNEYLRNYIEEHKILQ